MGEAAVPISIGSLPVLHLDYTKRGPGLHVGLTQLRAMLDAEGGREGFVLLIVNVAGVVLPIVLPVQICTSLESSVPECGSASTMPTGRSPTLLENSGTTGSIGASA